MWLHPIMGQPDTFIHPFNGTDPARPHSSQCRRKVSVAGSRRQCEPAGSDPQTHRRRTHHLKSCNEIVRAIVWFQAPPVGSSLHAGAPSIALETPPRRGFYHRTISARRAAGKDSYPSTCYFHVGARALAGKIYSCPGLCCLPSSC